MKINKLLLFLLPILITNLAVFLALWIGGLISDDMDFAMYIYQEAQPATWFIGIFAGLFLVIIEMTGNERNI